MYIMKLFLPKERLLNIKQGPKYAFELNFFHSSLKLYRVIDK